MGVSTRSDLVIQSWSRAVSTVLRYGTVRPVRIYKSTGFIVGQSVSSHVSTIGNRTLIRCEIFKQNRSAKHHLAIGRNIPLDRLVDWLVGLAPSGVVEFVTKDDPTVQKMLQLREDIFSIYTTETFVAALNRRARIVKTLNVSNTGRQLFWYDVK